MVLPRRDVVIAVIIIFALVFINAIRHFLSEKIRANVQVQRQPVVISAKTSERNFTMIAEIVSLILHKLSSRDTDS